MNTIFQPQQTEKHKIFISFHNDDQQYRDLFDQYYGNHFISKSVDFGDIDPDNKDDYIKRLIQEDHISDASIVVVLYGENTWRRKHVDWEIYAGLSEKVGGHSGLMIMILPTFPTRPNIDQWGNHDHTPLHAYLHPRTAANINSGFASLYYWSGMCPQLPSVDIKDAFRDAFEKRISQKDKIDLSHPQYQYNR